MALRIRELDLLPW